MWAVAIIALGASVGAEEDEHFFLNNDWLEYLGQLFVQLQNAAHTHFLCFNISMLMHLQLKLLELVVSNTP
jgi:hypothetical protein